MRQIYNFERYEPPILTESMLQKQLKERKLRKQMLVLHVAAMTCNLCFILFAFFIAPESIFLAVITIVLFGCSVIGNGVLTVMFCRPGAIKKLKYLKI